MSNGDLIVSHVMLSVLVNGFLLSVPSALSIRELITYYTSFHFQQTSATPQRAPEFNSVQCIGINHISKRTYLEQVYHRK